MISLQQKLQLLQFQEQEENIHIVCKKKRNNPRINIKICEAACDLKKDCEEYKNVKN